MFGLSNNNSLAKSIGRELARQINEKYEAEIEAKLNDISALTTEQIFNMLNNITVIRGASDDYVTLMLNECCTHAKVLYSYGKYDSEKYRMLLKLEGNSDACIRDLTSNIDWKYTDKEGAK